MELPLSWQRWLEEVLSAQIIFAPNDILREANGNLQSLNVPPESTPLPQVAQAEALVRLVVEARRRQLQDTCAARMRIYWWHDEQAGQLRFSIVSSSHQRLPFGCQLETASDISQIISDWLASPWLRGIPFSSLTACETPDEEPEIDAPELQTPYVLQVWSTELP